jgi:hypothetical protein
MRIAPPTFQSEQHDNYRSDRQQYFPIQHGPQRMSLLRVGFRGFSARR